MGIAIEGLPFFVIMSALVLYGLSQSHSATHGGGRYWGFAAWAYQHTVGAALNLIQAGERWIISKVAGAQLRLVALWFSTLALLWRAYFEAAGDVAHATAVAVEALDRALPRLIRREVAPARRLAHAAVRKAEAAAADARANARALDRFRARTDAELRAVGHAIDVTIPGELGRIRARERTLERDVGGLRDDVRSIEDGAINTWRWLRDHRTSAAMGVFTGVVAWALSRLGYGFLRCRSWRNLGRSLTCSDGDLLGLILGVVTASVASVSLVSLGHELLGLADDFVPAVTGFFTEVGAVKQRTPEQQGLL